MFSLKHFKVYLGIFDALLLSTYTLRLFLLGGQYFETIFLYRALAILVLTI